MKKHQNSPFNNTTPATEICSRVASSFKSYDASSLKDEVGNQYRSTFMNLTYRLFCNAVELRHKKL